MKNKRFLWLPFIAIIGFAGLYVISCQRDAEPTDTKSLSDTPLTERACGANECECTITIDSTVVVDLCGDAASFPDNCTACGDTKLGISMVMFEANVPRTFCVDKLGDLCITNRPTNVDTIVVTVRFGSSTPTNAMILPGQTQCFHTNGDCTLSSNGCQ